MVWNRQKHQPFKLARPNFKQRYWDSGASTTAWSPVSLHQHPLQVDLSQKYSAGISTAFCLSFNPSTKEWVPWRNFAIFSQIPRHACPASHASFAASAAWALAKRTEASPRSQRARGKGHAAMQEKHTKLTLSIPRRSTGGTYHGAQGCPRYRDTETPKQALAKQLPEIDAQQETTSPKFWKTPAAWPALNPKVLVVHHPYSRGILELPYRFSIIWVNFDNSRHVCGIPLLHHRWLCEVGCGLYDLPYVIQPFNATRLECSVMPSTTSSSTSWKDQQKRRLITHGHWIILNEDWKWKINKNQQMRIPLS